MIPLNVKVWRFSYLLLFLGGLISCSPLADLGIALPNTGNPPLTQISDLQQQTAGETVYLQGRVGDKAPFLGNGAYQLEDQTGKVWVLTQKSLPTQGKEILIKGQVEFQSISVGKQELGELYIIELEQLTTLLQPQPQPSTVKPEEDDLFLPHKRYK
ncbi:MAG: DNA-binding protein [Microcystaceae cyanobacterium]